VTATHTADAVLAAVLPADADRVRVHGVATSFADDLDADTATDVELVASLHDLRDAPVAVVVVDADPGGLDTGAGGRLAVRTRDHASARWRAAVAARGLRAAGFTSVTTVAWDRGQVAHLAAPSRPARSLRIAERLPRRATVVGQRGATGPSILSAASAAAGLGPTPPWPLVRSGTLVVLGDTDIVLRVAVGAGRERLRRAAGALAQAATSLDRPELLPCIAGQGSVGLGAWTTERRLTGAPCPPSLPDGVADEVLDVLAALHRAGRETAARRDDAATIVAVVGDGERAAEVRRIGETVDRDLHGLPTALSHGDFWHGNLLVRNGRLAGVIDWDAADDHGLPFADLLHLLVAARVPKGSTGWGEQVAAELERPDPSPLLDRHAAAIGLPVDPPLRRSLVAAYWLDRLATQLRTYADRVARPRWLAANVDPFVRAWQRSSR
jgi:hypothetical protein